MRITPIQIKAARAMLGWSREDLAAKTGLQSRTITNIEDSTTQARSGNIAKIEAALTAGGVDFLPDQGVRPRNDILTVITGADAWLRLLDDIYYTLTQPTAPKELLFHCGDDRLSSEAAIQSELRLRQAGIRVRSTVAASNDYLLFPVAEYRGIADGDFENAATAIYADCVATLLHTENRVIVIKNAVFAESQRKLFNIVWRNGKLYTQTTAKVTYAI